MNSIRANLVFVPFVLLTFTLSAVEPSREIPGAIELVGYSSRKARMNAESFDESQTVTLPMEKQKADIETVKRNIDAYNKLMKVDTKKLTNQQKDMLERIVERVARLKAVLDVDSSNNHTKDTKDLDATTASIDKPTTPMTPDASTATSAEMITTTLITDTTLKPDKNEARANNNLSPNHVNRDSLPKLRQTTTPKYSSGKTTTKRNIAHRVSLKHGSATTTSTSSTSPSTNPSHNAPVVTATPLQHSKQHAKPLNTPPSAVQETSTTKQLPQSSDIAEESTSAVNGGGSITSDLIYDSNETASSIIDTLANHAREDYYTKGPLSENNKGKVSEQYSNRTFMF